VSLSLCFLLLGAASCPAAAPVADAPGLPAVARLPTVEAMRRNGEGKKLYRQERWDEARAKYRAALAADPSLLGAALNVACTYSRQKRYAEAAETAAQLIRQAYVPWNREVKEAADLGILEDHPAAYAKVLTARRESATQWGEQVRKGVLFVARLKPPLRLAGEGVLVLRLNQEIFSWVPETGRFFQVTAEDGRVLGLAVSSNGRRIAYLLGGKVVRAAGKPGMLRGLSLRVLDLPSMALGPLVPIPGDVRQVQLWFAGTQPELAVTDRSGRQATFRPGTSSLVARPGRERLKGEDWVVLGEHGVELGEPYLAKGKCAFALRATEDSAGRRRLQVTRSGGKPFLLDTKYEAGLHGLPFPDRSAKPAK
jgi:tetratricopeptide (TPR) repeat protein